MKTFLGWFFSICFMGFFSCWIGGVEPFTEDAGGWAAITFVLAVIVGAFAAMVADDQKREYPDWYKK